MITSSSDQEEYFVTCSMADDWLTTACMNRSVIFYSEAWKTTLQKHSEIQFWDLKGAPEPVPMAIQQTIQRCKTGKTCTAGAVGLTSFGKGAVLAVASYNADTVDFYTSEADPFSGSPLNFKFTWTASKANKSGWLDNNFAQYQNVNLITQTDQTLWMVAFDRSGFSDWMDLYTVDLSLDHNSVLRKASNKHMYCSDGCEFSAGAGIFIASDDEFDVYAVNPLSGDHNTGTTIHANVFSAT